MSFAAPFALAAFALAIPIIGFYFLKVRLRQIPVSTSIFWRQIFDEQKPRSLWQTLRHWVSLAVQLLLLALLVLALADPFWKGDALTAQRIVLVLDHSASMSATDEAPTRLAVAKQAAADLIASLRMRDEMAIIAAGAEPRVVCGLTSHPRTLRERLADVPATDGPTRLADAVRLGKRLLAGHPRGRVLVFSDGCDPAVEELLKDEAVTWRPCGHRTGNVGITRWQARRSLLDPLTYEIFAEVFNASDEAVECRLEVDLNQLPVDVIPLKLAAGQVWSRTIEKSSQEGGQLWARLRTDDALVADNAAVALLPKRDRVKVVVAGANHFLRHAIEANPLVDLSIVDALPAEFDPRTIYIFHRLVPTKLPSSPTLVIDPRSDCELWKVGEPLANPIVTKQDTDSPLMRHVRLDNVLVPDARRLALVPTPAPRVLVEAVTGDALLASWDRPEAKTLVLTSNLDQGDLTFRTVFPILITNALAWFANPASELQVSQPTGALPLISLAAAGPTGRLQLRSPQDDVHPLPTGERITLGPLDRCGIWKAERVGVDGQPPHIPDVVHEVACNLANREESDLRPRAEFATAPKVASASSWINRPIWFALTAVACVLFTIEWWLYQRRWLG